MKLGLKYIETAYGTGENLPVINPGPWDKGSNFPTELGTGAITDAGIDRNDVRSTVTLMKYIPEGLLLCVAKRMNVRGDSSRSCEALWIFVPSVIDIKSHEIVEALNGVRIMFENKMAFSNPENFRAFLPQIFNRDFPRSAHPSPCFLMKGNAVAVIDCTSQFPLTRILSFGCQSAYSKYGLIILDENNRPVGPNVDVLSPSTFKEMVWVTLPKNLPAELVGKNFSVKIDNILLPESGLSVVAGQHKVTIAVEGYLPETIMLPILPGSSELNLNDLVRQMKWFQRIDVSIFKVKNTSGKDITFNCKFESNDVYDDRGMPKRIFYPSDTTVYVPKSKLGNFLITVVCKGYETKTDSLNLTDRRPVEIKLNEASRAGGMSDYSQNYRRDDYRSSGPSQPGGESLKMRKENTRLKGEVESLKNSLTLWRIIACAGIAAAIVFLILWLTKGPSEPKTGDDIIDYAEETTKIDQSAQDQTPTENIGGNQQESNTPSLQDAVKYLDNNSTWSKATMDTYPELRGLFEDMNNYNLPRLTSVWKEKLVGSTKFQDEIVHHAESRMRYDTNQKYLTLTPSDNGIIKVIDYKNKIDPGQGNFNKSQNQGNQQGAIQKTSPKSSNQQTGTNTPQTSASKNGTTGGSANKGNNNVGSKAGVNSGASQKPSENKPQNPWDV